MGEKVKIAIFAAGSYSKLLSHCPAYLPEFEFSFLCANWQSFREFNKNSSSSDAHYVYDIFIQIFKSEDVFDYLNAYSDINFANNF